MRMLFYAVFLALRRVFGASDYSNINKTYRGDLLVGPTTVSKAKINSF